MTLWWISTQPQIINFKPVQLLSFHLCSLLCSCMTERSFQTEGFPPSRLSPGGSVLVIKGESKYLWTHVRDGICYVDLLLFPVSVLFLFIYIGSIALTPPEPEQFHFKQEGQPCLSHSVRSGTVVGILSHLNQGFGNGKILRCKPRSDWWKTQTYFTGAGPEDLIIKRPDSAQ